MTLFCVCGYFSFSPANRRICNNAIYQRNENAKSFLCIMHIVVNRFTSNQHLSVKARFHFASRSADLLSNPGCPTSSFGWPTSPRTSSRVGQLLHGLLGLANFLCQSRHVEIETTSWLTFESASLVWQPASEVEFTNNLTFPYQTLLFCYLLIKNS